MLESGMRRAIDLAKLGPKNDLNPQVGAVILDGEGRIVSEGWHLGSGTKHAEVVALENIPETHRDNPGFLTALVTLEPCNHTGKTGPCSQALIEAGIGTVVYALPDPGPASAKDPDSAGGGARLRAAGVNVHTGLLATEARVLLSRWLTTRELKPKKPTPANNRPYIIAKWAQTLDGRAAAADGSSQWITGEEARAHVHSERALADAILVGTGTVLADDPSLTARDSSGALLVPAARQPKPIVFGRSQIPASAKINEHPGLSNTGTGPFRLNPTNLEEGLAELKRQGINSIYIEGGPQTISTFLQAGLVDEMHVYIAPLLLGGPKLAIDSLEIKTLAKALRLAEHSYIELGKDLLVVAKPATVAEIDEVE